MTEIFFHKIINGAIFAGDCTLTSQCDSGYACTSGSCGMYAYSLHLGSCWNSINY